MAVTPQFIVAQKFDLDNERKNRIFGGPGGFSGANFLFWDRGNILDNHFKQPIIKKFVAEKSGFKSKCGSNPDFIMDNKNGDVYPEPQKPKGKKDKASPCRKADFTLNVSDVLHKLLPSRSPSPGPGSRPPSPAPGKGKKPRSLNEDLDGLD
ncbi:hypothetical protein C8J56DRAFT_1021123 [Mycena floridula]|nr:hypothetical protein C8J56DRAFT_1021123 [Mycena floridula]